MGAVVEVLPLLQLVVEQLGVVDDEAVKHPVELFLVDAVGSLHLAVEAGCGRLMYTCLIPRSKTWTWNWDPNSPPLSS